MYPDTFNQILLDLKSKEDAPACFQRALALDKRSSDCLVFEQALTDLKAAFIGVSMSQFPRNRLVLQGCRFTPAELKLLFQSLRETQLSNLMICDCRLERGSIFVLLEWIRKFHANNPTFHLALPFNSITTDDAFALIVACRNADYLDLSFNAISGDILKLFEKHKKLECPRFLELKNNLLMESERSQLKEILNAYDPENLHRVRLNSHFDQPSAGVVRTYHTGIRDAWIAYVVQQWDLDADPDRRATLIEVAATHLLQIGMLHSERTALDPTSGTSDSLPVLCLYGRLFQADSPFKRLTIDFPSLVALQEGESRQALFTALINLLELDGSLNGLSLDLRYFTLTELVKIGEVIGKSRCLQNLSLGTLGPLSENCFFQIVSDNSSITRLSCTFADRPNDAVLHKRVTDAFNQNVTLLKLSSGEWLTRLFAPYQKRNRRIASRDHNQPFRPELRKVLMTLAGGEQKVKALPFPSLQEMIEAQIRRQKRPKEILLTLIAYLERQAERTQRSNGPVRIFRFMQQKSAVPQSKAQQFTSLLQEALEANKDEAPSFDTVLPLVAKAHRIACVQRRVVHRAPPASLQAFREILDIPETWEKLDEEEDTLVTQKVRRV